MYLPVAIECGHKFCGRCAIAIALGRDGTRGDVNSLLASGPVGHSEVPCPQCRAAEHGNFHGVFYNAKKAFVEIMAFWLQRFQIPVSKERVQTRFPWCLFTRNRCEEAEIELKFTSCWIWERKQKIRSPCSNQGSTALHKVHFGSWITSNSHWFFLNFTFFKFRFNE